MMKGEYFDTTFEQKLFDVNNWMNYLIYMADLISKSSKCIQYPIKTQDLCLYPLDSNKQIEDIGFRTFSSGNDLPENVYSIRPDLMINDDRRYLSSCKLPNKKVVVKEEEEKGEESLPENRFLQRKKARNSKMCSGCPHHFARHYAKNMCSNCYHSKGRVKKPWNCPHTTKTHYALGLCQNCYQMNYTKNKKDSTLNSSSQDIN